MNIYKVSLPFHEYSSDAISLILGILRENAPPPPSLACETLRIFGVLLLWVWSEADVPADDLADDYSGLTTIHRGTFPTLACD